MSKKFAKFLGYTLKQKGTEIEEKRGAAPKKLESDISNFKHEEISDQEEKLKLEENVQTQQPIFIPPPPVLPYYASSNHRHSNFKPHHDNLGQDLRGGPRSNGRWTTRPHQGYRGSHQGTPRRDARPRGHNQGMGYRPNQNLDKFGPDEGLLSFNKHLH